jgi:ABC-type glycerol-3-phosphate transport system substrate-binding protein
MSELKAIQFLASNEHFNIIEQIGNFLQMTWEDERMSKIFSLTEDIIRYNQTSETPVKELIKKWLDFLNEEEVNKLYNFLEENFLPKVRELWQEEDITEEESEETEEESFEERAKRYIELMQTIIKYPQRPKQEKVEEKPKKKEETKKEAEEYKTITFQPQQEHKKEAEEESLPEDVIVITKKKEEKTPEGEEFLDLSRL